MIIRVFSSTLQAKPALYKHLTLEIPMIRLLFLFAVLLVSHGAALASPDSLRTDPAKRKGSFTFYWGYNRSYFSKSDIHFTGPNYDFTVYDVVSHDRPSKFAFKTYLHPTHLWIPQYNFRFGYFITDRFHISFGTDHMKYVMDHDQSVKISGVISAEASAKYAGAYLNEEIKLTRDFLTFEHTDGLNLTTVEADYLLPLASLWRKRININLNGGVGGIWMVTRTDVRVFGDGFNNDFHIAGFSMSAKAGPRIDLFKHFFVTAELKAGYVTLPWVLIKNSAPMHADHNFTFIQYYVAAGGYFRLWK